MDFFSLPFVSCNLFSIMFIVFLAISICFHFLSNSGSLLINQNNKLCISHPTQFRRRSNTTFAPENGCFCLLARPKISRRLLTLWPLPFPPPSPPSSLPFPLPPTHPLFPSSLVIDSFVSRDRRRGNNVPVPATYGQPRSIFPLVLRVTNATSSITALGLSARLRSCSSVLPNSLSRLCLSVFFLCFVLSV